MDESKIHPIKRKTSALRKILQRRPFASVMAGGAVIGTGIVSLFLINCTLHLNIDGDEMRQLTNETEPNQIAAEMNQDGSDMPEFNYTTGSRGSGQFTFTRRDGETGGANIEQTAFQNTQEPDMKYVISIDGREAGYVSDLNSFRKAVQGRLDDLMEKDTVSASYHSDIQYEYKYPVGIKELTERDLLTLLEDIPVEMVSEVTYSEAIYYETKYIDNPSQYTGSNIVSQNGQDGKRMVTASISYIDGVEQSRKILQSSVVEMPVPEVILKGSGDRPPTASAGSYIWPAEGRLSSSYGPRTVSVGSSNHKGIDIACPANTPIYAADGGKVIYSGWMSGYGNLVQILHDNGQVTYYAHCNSLDVTAGQRVSQGQLIARAGMTGTASGNHLHFEIRINGDSINPISYLP